jgi:hypothetical protein
MAIELKQGLGKDGNPTIPYVRNHPTNYVWRDDIERLTRGLVNREAFERRIWINTYERHPPGGEDDFWRHRDRTSFDVWGFGGRGDPLPKELGNRVYDALFDDPDPPDIWWIIWQGEIWNRFYKRPRRRPFPGGAGAADMGHFSHLHVTYLDAEDQK